MSSVLNSAITPPGAVTTVTAGGSPNKSPVTAQSMTMQHATNVSQNATHITQASVENPNATHIPVNMGSVLNLHKISTTNIPQQMLHEQMNIEQITNISRVANLTNIGNISNVEQNFTMLDSFHSNVNQNMIVGSNFPGLHNTGQIPVVPHLPNVTNLESTIIPTSDSMLVIKSTEKLSEESTITQSNGTVQVLNQSENICSMNVVSGSLTSSDPVLEEQDSIPIAVSNINPSITARSENIKTSETLATVKQIKELSEVIIDNSKYQTDPPPITSTDDLVKIDEKPDVTQSDSSSELILTSPKTSTTPSKPVVSPKSDDPIEERAEDTIETNVPSDSVTSTTAETSSAISAISTPSRPVSAIATSTTGPTSPIRAALPAKILSTMRLATVNKPRGNNRRRVEYRTDRSRESENGVDSGAGGGSDKRKSKRVRTTTQMYQSPIPELALLTKISANQARVVKTPDDKLIAFYKNEFLAVRNTEGGFFICQAVRNVYKTSTRIRIRWLSKENSDATGDVYSPDFYDFTEFDCILTNLNMERVDKGLYRLPAAELERTLSILQRALDVEQGVAIKPCVTEEHPDGLDLSLYKDESQLDKKVTKKKRTINNSKSRINKYESEDSIDGDNDSYDEEDSGSDYSHTPKRTQKKTAYTAKRIQRGMVAAKSSPKRAKKEIIPPRIIASTSAIGSSGSRAERAKRRAQPLEADSPSTSTSKKSRVAELKQRKEPNKRTTISRQAAKTSPIPSTSRNIRGSSTLLNPTPSTSRGLKRGRRI